VPAPDGVFEAEGGGTLGFAPLAAPRDEDRLYGRARAKSPGRMSTFRSHRLPRLPGGRQAGRRSRSLAVAGAAAYDEGEMSGYEEYIRAFRERDAAETAALTRARQLAEEAAGRAAAAVLRHRPGRLLLIGSLQRGTWRPGSDIDLAVEGLTAAQTEQAEVEASRAAGMDVDVRRLESMDPEWRAHHLRFGVSLHGG